MNPYYILALLGGVLLILLFKIAQVENAGQQHHQSYLLLKEKGEKIKHLEGLWSSKSESLKRVNAILLYPGHAKYVADKEQKGNSYRVSFENLDKPALKKLSGKLLNEALLFNRFEIIRNSDNNATLKVDIKL